MAAEGRVGAVYQLLLRTLVGDWQIEFVCDLEGGGDRLGDVHRYLTGIGALTRSCPTSKEIATGRCYGEHNRRFWFIPLGRYAGIGAATADVAWIPRNAAGTDLVDGKSIGLRCRLLQYGILGAAWPLLRTTLLTTQGIEIRTDCHGSMIIPCSGQRGRTLPGADCSIAVEGGPFDAGERLDTG